MAFETENLGTDLNTGNFQFLDPHCDLILWQEQIITVQWTSGLCWMTYFFMSAIWMVKSHVIGQTIEIPHSGPVFKQLLKNRIGYLGKLESN